MKLLQKTALQRCRWWLGKLWNLKELRSLFRKACFSCVVQGRQLMVYWICCEGCCCLFSLLLSLLKEAWAVLHRKCYCQDFSLFDLIRTSVVADDTDVVVNDTHSDEVLRNYDNGCCCTLHLRRYWFLLYLMHYCYCCHSWFVTAHHYLVNWWFNCLKALANGNSTARYTIFPSMGFFPYHTIEHRVQSTQWIYTPLTS